MYISNIFSIVCIFCIANVAILEQKVSAEEKTISKRTFHDIIISTPLVLAHIRGTEECDAECKEHLKVLGSIKEALSIFGVKVLQSVNAKLLEPYNSQGKHHNNLLFFFRHSVPLLYEATTTASPLKSEDLLEFVQQNKDQIYSKTLNDQVFEHQTQASTGSTTGDWFILFYSAKCDEYVSVWETLAARLSQHKVLARVDMSESPATTQRFSISKCPSALYLRAGKYYPYEQPMDLSKMVLFAEGWYKNAPSHSIKPLPTFFDNVLDKIVSLMKESEAFKYLIGLLPIAVIVIVVTCFYKKSTNEVSGADKND